MLIVSDFECTFCLHIFEDYLIEPETYIRQCPKCHNIAKRIITFNAGHRADPTWLESACDLLQPDGERPIESKSEFDKYLKKHNIVQRC